MFGKVVKPNNGTPDELEKSIGEALLDLEVNSDLKTQLRELYITGAKEMEVGDKKKCLIVFVPVPLLKQFQKIQVMVVLTVSFCAYCWFIRWYQVLGLSLTSNFILFQKMRLEVVLSISSKNLDLYKLMWKLIMFW